MSASKEEKFTEQSIADLINSNLYDVKILSQLEEYVVQQVRLGTYDLEANRHLLKLYLFHTDTMKIDTVGKILLKSLTALPASDYLQCIYVLSEKVHSVEPVKTILKLAGLLDQCSFKKFWKEAELARAILDQIPGFDDAIRDFITTTVQSTYRVISVSMLKDYWNLSEKKTFDERVDRLVSQSGWQRAEDGKALILPIPSQHKNAQQQRHEYIALDRLSDLLTRFTP